MRLHRLWVIERSAKHSGRRNAPTGHHKAEKNRAAFTARFNFIGFWYLVSRFPAAIATPQGKRIKSNQGLLKQSVQDYSNTTFVGFGLILYMSLVP